MDGLGLIKGMGVTLKRFIDTYLYRKSYYSGTGIERATSPEGRGAFTIQYPEEKLKLPEEFRFVPFLIYDELEGGERKIRCTACGICAKVCPTQCIWIVRAKNPETGRPVPEPEEFYIDVDICMNCGLCAEYCPFDSIKMDHDYELAVYDRSKNIYDLEKLLKPASYYAEIRPVNYQREEEARQKAAAAKAARQKKAKN